MECFEHTLESLFEQLGLASDQKAMAHFIEQHSLSNSDTIISAPFWTKSQRQFLSEAYAEDSDWTEQIDILATLLRKK